MTDALLSHCAPVHRSLLEQSQLFGVGTIPALLVGGLTFILVYLFSSWFLLLGFTLLIIMNRLCADDPNTLLYILQRLQDFDRYYS